MHSHSSTVQVETTVYLLFIWCWKKSCEALEAKDPDVHIITFPSGVVVPGEVGILAIYGPNFFFFKETQQKMNTTFYKQLHVKLVFYI